MAKKTQGRKKGGRNRGYYYRKNRGWYATEGSARIPLRYENGEHIKDERADERDIREAHARHVLAKQQVPEVQSKTTVLEVCLAYLADAKANGAPKTHADRADTLFDFCYGVPPEFRTYSPHDAFHSGLVKESTDQTTREAEAKRVHQGYGNVPVVELTPLDINAWLNAHPTWTKGGRRSRIQAVKRAFNFAAGSLIPENPICGYHTPKSNPRVTYVTDEQEAALLDRANPALKMALQVCIRTGARPGVEFASVRKRHVRDHGERMEWTFPPAESKTGKLRIIRIVDESIIAIVREQMQKYPTGPLFRSISGDPWSLKNLSARFRLVRNCLAEGGWSLTPIAACTRAVTRMPNEYLKGTGQANPPTLKHWPG